MPSFRHLAALVPVDQPDTSPDGVLADLGQPTAQGPQETSRGNDTPDIGVSEDVAGAGQQESGSQAVALSRALLQAGSASNAARPGCYYRVIHKPRIAVLAEPSRKGEILHALRHGDVFHVGEELDNGWVQLAADEAWARDLKTGFVLVDGAEVGLGRLIERLEDEAVTEDTWPFSSALRLAAAAGVPFSIEAGQFQPFDAQRLQQRWLSLWHRSGTAEPVSWLPAAPLSRAAPAVPRLCVALLLRGTPAASVESFVLYHHAIGFERVMLFFDAPKDPLERSAIEAALNLACNCDGGRFDLQVHMCTEEWWNEVKSESRFYIRRNSSDKVYREMRELHENVHDVQARQCLAIERAIHDAHRDGFDWLLHIDSDELLLLPQWRDARRFFESVPRDMDQVIFYNLEAVPESLEVDDWFQDVSLFKVHQSLLHDPEEAKITSEEALARRRRRDERRRRRAVKQGADPDDARENTAFDLVMFGVKMKRRESSFDFEVQLPPLDSDSDKTSDPDEAARPSKSGWRHEMPCFYAAYSNGKAAVRLRPGVPPPLPVGVHRCTSDANGRLPSFRCRGEGAPVVLHYANCGFRAWRRKYEILSTGHGTTDGGFSVERKGIKSMRAHLAHRDMLRRADDQQLESYYRTFIMANEFGELPHFACHGLVVRTRAVLSVLRVAITG